MSQTEILPESTAEAAYIRIRGVTKKFDAISAVDTVDLNIRKGEIFALLGASGCGKTTLLRLLAGFEIPTDGQITIDGQDMQSIQPYNRPVNMMFQSYALFPSVRLGVSPKINALATIVVLFVSLCAAVAGILMFRAERRRKFEIQAAMRDTA